MKTVIRSIKDLKVYNNAYKFAMEIFEITKDFPKEEIYSLTDQIKKSFAVGSYKYKRRIC